MGARILVLLAVAWASPTLAAGFHYASSTNRIYVEKGGSATLSDIKAALPSAPLDLVSTSPNVWLLRANLQIIDGTALVLHGTAIGGDVDELRIQSNNDSSGYVTITADYGSVEIDSTKIQSWDAAASGPDTDYSNGRAYIHVRSKLAADGVTPLESRMDIANADVSYLGFNGAEAYGLVWKVNGFTGSNPSIFDQVQVRGDISNSHIYHNYYGVYTFGHQDGVWTGNEVDHNAGYGFDPHDDTDNLLIEDNEVHDNGNHGIIASKRCDHVIVRNNRSYNNHGNGIMLHRSSNDGLVELNQSHDNSDSGVAIFASARAIVRNNALLNNASAGVRMSVGAADSTVTGNEVAGSQYGFYFYKGTDAPEPGDDGRPKRNLFQSNNVHDIPSDGIHMSDGDANRFVKNTFANVGTQFTFSTSTATELTSNTVPATVTVTLDGTASLPSVVTVRNQAVTTVQILDAASKALFRDSRRAAFDPDESIYTSITPTESVLTLTQALIGTTSTVFLRKLFATPSGTNVLVQPTLWSANRAWKAKLSNSGGSVQYEMWSLTPGAQYRVNQGGAVVGTFTADASGRVVFSVTPGVTTVLNYTMTKL